MKCEPNDVIEDLWYDKRTNAENAAAGDNGVVTITSTETLRLLVQVHAHRGSGLLRDDGLLVSLGCFRGSV